METDGMEIVRQDRSPGPGRWWYVVGAAILAVTPVVTAAFVIQRVMGGAMDMQRVVVPGEARLNLSRPGCYTIYHEYRSTVDGKIYSSAPGLPGLECALKDGKTGRVVKLRPVNVNIHYTRGSREGVGIFQFDITDPGEYVLTSKYSGAGMNAPAVLALDRDFFKELFVMIFGGIGIMCGGWALAIVVILLTYFRRRKALAAPAPPPARL